MPLITVSFATGSVAYIALALVELLVKASRQLLIPFMLLLIVVVPVAVFVSVSLLLTSARESEVGQLSNVDQLPSVLFCTVTAAIASALLPSLVFWPYR